MYEDGIASRLDQMPLELAEADQEKDSDLATMLLPFAAAVLTLALSLVLLNWTAKL